MKSFLTIKEIKDKLENKEVSIPEIRSFYLHRIKQYNPQLNALLEVYDNADSLEPKDPVGALAGIPGVVKDNICSKEQISSCASKILSNFRSPYDATVVRRLKDAGALIVGRGNMDEFAMGSSGEFSAFGPTKNPWNKNYSPGGSSSGPAAAVTAGLVPWALGSETGGSVRQPASFCGLVGLYPTYGTFSRNGLIAFASSFDQVGPLTKTVYDNALVTSVISGHDPKDGTSLSKPTRDFTKNLNGKLPENFTIGVLKDALESEGVHPEVKKAFEESLKQLESMGARIKTVELPDLKYGISVYFVISRAEAASNLYRYDGTLYGVRDKDVKSLHDMYFKTRHDNLGSEVQRRILMGNYVLSSGHKDAFYNKAQQVRALIKAEFEEAFKDVDVITSPTTPTLPFKLGKECADPLALYLADYFTVPNCIAGLPALSVPCGFSGNGFPIGIQFMGPRLSEELLYQVAYAYEQSTGYHLEVPKGF